MSSATISQLIINSPYEEPAEHWRYDRETRTFSRVAGRRPAGYVRATPGAKTFDDPGGFFELPFVNRIRERVKAWRERHENPYAGTTGITKRLLEHWRDPEQRGEDRRLFFCQLDAIETLVWLAEAPAAERQGIEIPGDGGEFTRWCAKMATGSGKTIVMAMAIAWQVLNKVTYPQDKRQFEISWPNIIRIDHAYRPQLVLDMSRVKRLLLDATETALRAEMARLIEGKPELTSLTEIDLMKLAREFRMQKIVFETARDVYDQMKPAWKASREFLLAQVVGIVERFLSSDRIQISPPLFAQDDLRRRIVITLNMTKLVQHIWEAIRFENTEALEPVFDDEHPIRSTADMRPWYTGKPCEMTKRSHINFCVYDSTWEASESFELDRDDKVAAWAKNDHLGFEILYVFKGVVHKYRPDFLIRLKSSAMLVLEVKGQDSQEHQTKREFLGEWVKAVNAHGGFGQWMWDVSRHPKDVAGIMEKHCAAEPVGQA